MKEEKQCPVVCFGETLWDILPEGKLPGGAPMNVAYHLNKMGKNPAAITRIGKDELGEELLHVWQSRKVDTSFFQFDEKVSTGKVYAKSDENNNMHYDIVQPSAWDYIEWKDELLPLIKNATYFVFGSLVTRNEESRNTLFRCLEFAKIKVLDINLRTPYYSKEILEELIKRADILKLNLEELILITSWLGNFENDEERVKSLQNKFGVNTIIVTKGSAGAMLYVNNVFYYHRGFVVNVADTVGSGDAFLVRFIKGLIDRESYSEILKQACAMGAFIASKNGACPEYDLSDISKSISL